MTMARRAKFPRGDLIATALLLSTATAYAQQPQPAPLEASLSQRVMAEVGANVQCNAANIDLQRQLQAAQARIKELEAKQGAAAPEK